VGDIAAEDAPATSQVCQFHAHQGSIARIGSPQVESLDIPTLKIKFVHLIVHNQQAQRRFAAFDSVTYAIGMVEHALTNLKESARRRSIL
jgi:hypothetical protein